MKARVSDKSIYMVSVLMAIAWAAAAILLKILDASLAIRVAIGLVPAGLLVYQIYLCYRYTVGQDEVQKRIILEGLAIAFSIVLPVIFILGFIMKAGIKLPFEFIDSGYFMEISLLIGYSIAYRRYQ